MPGTYEATDVGAAEMVAAEIVHSTGSLQMEVIATFTFTANPKAVFGVSVLGGTAEAVVDCSNTTIQNKGETVALSGGTSLLRWAVIGRSLLVRGRPLLHHAAAILIPRQQSTCHTQADRCQDELIRSMIPPCTMAKPVPCFAAKSNLAKN